MFSWTPGNDDMIKVCDKFADPKERTDNIGQEQGFEEGYGVSIALEQVADAQNKSVGELRLISGDLLTRAVQR